MKKFKSILCGALAFVAGSVALSACGVKTEPQTDPTEQTAVVGSKTIISLAEAKKIIVKALAINDNSQTQSLSTMALQTASAEEGNRDIMEKLGRFNASSYCKHTDVETDIEIIDESLENIEMFYQGKVKIALLKDSKRYYSGSILYSLDNDNMVQIETRDDYNTQLSSVRALFKDEAFDKIYDENATKETNQNGYSITLTGDLEGWIRYTWLLYGHDDKTSDEEYEKMIDDAVEQYKEGIKDLPQETIDKCYFNLTVNIDSNNDVVSAAVNLKWIHDDMFEYIFLTLTKTNEPITEPEWVTEYKQAHA